MKRLTPTTQFMIVFWAAGFLLTILFDVMLWRSVAQDEILKESLSRWKDDRQSAILLWQFLLGPLGCVGGALWWYFKAPHEGYAKPRWLTMRVIVIFVVFVFAWNLVIFRFLFDSPYAGSCDSTLSRWMVVSHTVLTSPGMTLSFLLFAVFAFWWIFKPRDLPVNENEKLLVFAMMLGGVAGFLLAFLIKP